MFICVAVLSLIATDVANGLAAIASFVEPEMVRWYLDFCDSRLVYV
jgi:hypothetical protein